MKRVLRSDGVARLVRTGALAMGLLWAPALCGGLLHAQEAGQGGGQESGQSASPSAGPSQTALGQTGSSQTALSQPPAQKLPPALVRLYKPGQTLHYLMNGNNDGWKYELHADLVVARDDAGLPYEDLVWSRMHTNTVADPSLAALSFEQKLSLDGPAKYLAIPDLKSVQPPLVGPITDMLTFYSDVFLAHQLMRHSQGHAFFAYGKPNSWADGRRVLLGQDSIDFDVTLEDEQEGTHSAVLVVRHVPPRVPQIALPAPWMQAITGSPANNWVQVTHTDEGYLAQVGRETFEVHLTLDTEDGKILSSTLANPLDARQRLCQDASLSICGPETPFHTKREVSLRLLP